MEVSELLHQPAHEVARRLLGATIERTIDQRVLRLKIVETEAYDQNDPASHSYRGLTKRNKMMFGPAGRAYIYFTYGLHYCFNIVCGEEGNASAVLIRAVEPLENYKELRRNRPGVSEKNFTNGPAKLTKALSIDMSLNGHDLTKAPLKLVVGLPLSSEEIVSAYRVGISSAKEIAWRFYVKHNSYVSRL